MNKLRASLVALCAALLVPAVASAAVDMFLQIKGAKGDTRVVQCPAGACMVSGLAPGKYAVAVCDAQGKVIPTDIVLHYTVITARETGSGMATGRRQYQPIRLSKAVPAAGAPATNEIAIDEPGVHVAIGVSAEAAEAAVTKATKTRSNIQNN